MSHVPQTSSPLRLLLVEDDMQVAVAVRDALHNERFVLEHARNVAEAAKKLTEKAYAVVILDLTLPDGTGLNIADAIRASGNDVPILMLTAKDTVAERVEGFRHGADDYLCKPFAIGELTARLHAILRRSRTDKRYTLTYLDTTLDLIKRKVTRQNTEATLSAREMELLAYLMRHPEEVLRRERILEEVWGDEAEDDSNVLNVYINYLRNKLERGQYPRIIHTVRGTGYILSAREPEQFG